MEERTLRSFFILVLSLALQTTISQTCLVIYKDSNQIYAGADSRMTYINQNTITGKIDTTLGTMCKIYTTNTYSFAVSGKMAFSLIKTAKAAISIGGSLAEIGRIARYSMDNEYAYESLMKPNIDDSPQVIGGVYIFGFENDTPKVLLLSFYLEKLDNVKFGIGSSQRFIDSVDVSGNIREILGQNILYKPETWAGGIADGFTRIISTAIKYHPTTVGMPIDILQVSRRQKK